MELYIAFGKRCLPFSPGMNDLTVQIFGQYTKAFLVVVLETRRAVCFSASIATEFFEELDVFSNKSAEFNASHDLLRLTVTSEEADRILRTCRGCVQARKRFNLRDLALRDLPFREPAELQLFETRSLNDTQSVILILRECLELDNPVSVLVRGLHSRLATASALFDTLSPLLPHCTRLDLM